MRMKQLCERAGVPKGTIQFYINEGLIPRPIKTHANMAYYTEEHVKAIRLVKELQTKRFLPLAVIKQMIGEARDGLNVDEIRTLMEIDGRLFQNLRENPEVKPVTARKLGEQTGVSQQEIRELERLRVLHPVDKGKRKVFEQDDIRIVECLTRLREVGLTEELGFSTDILKLYRKFLEALVEEEAKIMISRVSGKVDARDLPRMVEDATAILNTVMGVIHRKIIMETVRRYTIEFKDRI